ncbi:MAG: hypothetical protein IAE97_01760 [Chthoniobacterales bacterium]|nr:hypothetical protein [Chthoniobacterales bacterium]
MEKKENPVMVFTGFQGNVAYVLGNDDVILFIKRGLGYGLKNQDASMKTIRL